jgi:hypothetical protein
MVMNAWGPMVQFATPLPPLCEMLTSMYVGQKQLQAFPSTTFNSYHRQVDIVLTKDGISTLANIVIVDPTHANLLLQSYTTQGFSTSINAIQAKERNYHN